MTAFSLAPLFRDHAVLQRDQAIPVWGRAAPHETITVSFRGQEASTTANEDGRWTVTLQPMPATGESADLTVAGNTTIVLRDVLMGEVWLATGQSNMNRPVSSMPDATEVLARIDQPLIRHINVALTLADEPAENVATSGWLKASPETVGDFSAVAWFFSDELFHKLDMPIGIIHSSWGGSNIEAWMDERTLQSTAAWPAIKKRWDHMVTNYATIKDTFTAWQDAEEEAKASGRENTMERPPMPLGPGTQRQLSGPFNGMLAPLQPYAVRGNIWYQGEANWDQPTEYAELFPAMINAWRAQWGIGKFPFYFVQLPNYTDDRDTTKSAWAKIREAQTSALDLPHTGMAVTVDCGDPDNLHPQNKPIVGQRLAGVATAKVYGLTGDWSGPVFTKAVLENATLRALFDHTGSGLIAKSGSPQSFEIAGVDRKFHPATATIDGSSVIVQSPAVPEPRAVRYAWNNTPNANLYNGADLPAAPFRSDEW